jgi:hypothetical protein
MSDSYSYSLGTSNSVGITRPADIKQDLKPHYDSYLYCGLVQLSIIYDIYLQFPVLPGERLLTLSIRNAFLVTKVRILRSTEVEECYLKHQSTNTSGSHAITFVLSPLRRRTYLGPFTPTPQP